jgi:DNA-binding response OmpR family regulator
MTATQDGSILVIDDEPNLRRVLAAILQRAGYAVTTAGSGDEAMRLLRAGAFDLTFLDLRMPDINGLELLPQIRQLYPDMPVLILTAHATLDSAIEAVRRGARDYLIKPIDPPQIIERVSEVLTEQRQPQRRKAIVGQIQELLAELHEIDGSEPPPANPLGTVQATDPSRFLHCGPFVLDLHARHVTAGGRYVSLPPATFDYFVTLVRHSPDTVPYETLVNESQGYRVDRIEAREMARWQIHELRKALESDPREPRHIITVRNGGYRLVP